MSGSVRCPRCGHVLFALEVPITSAVQSRDLSPPDAPLLLRVSEAAKLLGVSRSVTKPLLTAPVNRVPRDRSRSGCCGNDRLPA